MATAHFSLLHSIQLRKGSRVSVTTRFGRLTPTFVPRLFSRDVAERELEGDVIEETGSRTAGSAKIRANGRVLHVAMSHSLVHSAASCSVHYMKVDFTTAILAGYMRCAEDMSHLSNLIVFFERCCLSIVIGIPPFSGGVHI
ncbi:hypothetical protein MUK42_04798 [Musa troglodytarum]|uniref:Uncharacterized protein n=1 Tax=Musa troglodytarum TaxID=320322 RepID=A0A9E7KV03_9LILI|nr:hypothetical protein MUK42_04798 [Musa troglodytarum]